MKKHGDRIPTKATTIRFAQILMAIISLSSITVSAEIYKWVDEDGKVHFDDRPGGTNKEKLELKSTASSPSTDTELQKRLEEERKLLETFEEERHERDAKRTKEKEKKKKRDKEIKIACAEAKDYQKSAAGARVYDLDENGERVFLSDEERNAEDKELRDFIEKNCK